MVAVRQYHEASELRFADACHATNIVHFTAASAHNASRVNTVAYDVLTGEALCDCKAAENGRACWHVKTVAAAWANHPEMIKVAPLADDELLGYGRRFRNLIETSVRRRWNVPQAYQVRLLAARSEYKRRG